MDKLNKALKKLQELLPLEKNFESLKKNQQKLYLGILNFFIKKGRVLSKAEMEKYTDELEKDLQILSSLDMIVLKDKTVIGAYPMTMEKRDYLIKVNDFEIYGMCALDSLAISPMFNIKTTIFSKCEISKEEIILHLDKDKIINLQENKNLHFGIQWDVKCCEDSCCANTLCHSMIFLANEEIAKSWLNKDIQNREIFTIDEALKFSRLFFEPLVK